MPRNEFRDVGRRGGLPDGIRHIDGEKIGAFEKAADRLQADVVGIHMPSLRPSLRGDRSLGGIEDALRLGPDERVLPIRLVPDRHHLDAGVVGELLEGAKLGPGLMREAVTNTKGEAFESEHGSNSVESVGAAYRLLLFRPAHGYQALSDRISLLLCASA